MSTITVNSADSHVMEPDDLWTANMPQEFSAGALRVENAADGFEHIIINGKLMRRESPAMLERTTPPGVRDPAARLHDLDAQGVRFELLFPSRGLWLWCAQDAGFAAASVRVYNDWIHDSFMRSSPRFIGAAMISLMDVPTAQAEMIRAKEMGFKALTLPCTPPMGLQFNSVEFEPVWSTAEELEIPLCFHVGTGIDPVVARGPGGAVINYVETFHPAQRAVANLVASGVLERHPKLQVAFIEGGASWLASLCERMDEGYRQHEIFARPKLTMLPSDYVRRQVHASFQRDRAALRTTDITGLGAVMFGTDYPHMEGTWPKTQETLAEIFDGASDEVRDAVAGGNLSRLLKLGDLSPSPV
jgi:predicted TIM-barrel fold metal-dependent hydrolase